MKLVYPCFVCPKLLKSKRGFRFHLKHDHQFVSSEMSNKIFKNSQIILTCSHCHKQFSNKRLLKKHLFSNHFNLLEGRNSHELNTSHQSPTTDGLEQIEVPSYDKFKDIKYFPMELNLSGSSNSGELTIAENYEIGTPLTEFQFTDIHDLVPVEVVPTNYNNDRNLTNLSNCNTNDEQVIADNSDTIGTMDTLEELNLSDYNYNDEQVMADYNDLIGTVDNLFEFNLSDQNNNDDQVIADNNGFETFLTEYQSTSSHDLVPIEVLVNDDNARDLNDTMDTHVGLNSSDSNDNDGISIAEKHEFETNITMIQSIKSDIIQQFAKDPNYFKGGLQTFINSVKEILSSDDESLLSACLSFEDDMKANLNNR